MANIGANFGGLNWAIVAGYLAGTLVLGYFLSKRVRTAQHYYLGQRTTPWWVIGVSVVATYFGAITFLGGPAWSYKDGFAVIFIHINYPIVIFIVNALFLPFFYNTGVASIFDYLERRFGIASRTLMSAVFLFGNVAYSGIMLYTTALVLQLITGMDVVNAILIIAVVAVTYTMLGGIAAVIWTDLIQSVILFIGVAVVGIALAFQLPDGLVASLQELKASGKANPFEYTFDPSVVATVWTGVVAMTVYHIVVYGVNQMMIQRTLAARTLGDAKKAYAFMGYAAFLAYFVFFGIGILLYSYYGGREFDNDNRIILDFVATIGIPGLMGVITAAIVAAAMSSLDSSLNSMATVTTLDFYEKFFRKGRNATPEHQLRASRWFTLMWAVVMVAPAIIVARTANTSVLEILSKVGVFLVGSKLAMFGLGFYSRHATERGVLTGVAAGFVTLWYVETSMEVAWPWYAVLGGAVSIGVSLLASLLMDGLQKCIKARRITRPLLMNVLRKEYSPWTVRGQRLEFARKGLPEKQDGWWMIPGKVDRSSRYLLVYFVLCVAMLAILYRLI